MLDYVKALNKAQYEAATCEARSALIIAGAGSGKTRTIVYRMAWLAEHGVSPESILLLTFTRKAANEMMGRASNLLSGGLSGVSGGTFHSFAYGVLRRYYPIWLKNNTFTLMDQPDILQAIRDCKDKLKLGKKDPSFPRSQMIASLFSKARNKELPITELLRRDSFHLLPHAEALTDLFSEFSTFKREKALLDYDDLLFELEALLAADGNAASSLRAQYSHILVDEYQDTNLVQARLIRLLAGSKNNGELSASVMAVGDEAQSIYGFRGANVQNILSFPKLFPDTKIIRLEENYRSTQAILDVANDILSHASESFHKRLFSSRTGGEMVRLLTPLSDSSEAQIVVNRIQELLTSNLPHEIAVLFRSGFHSYPLEAALRRAGIPFRKYGGLRFVEASHIKDILSYARLAINPLDLPAFSRLAAMAKGVGPKTSIKLHNLLVEGNPDKINKAFARFPDLLSDMRLIEDLRDSSPSPRLFFDRLIDHFRPRLEILYPDDWPSRLQGLEEILQLAMSYEALDLFVADLALETPEDDESGDREKCVTLSTIHSAKGLEWNAVLLLDLVEDRFPSRHAQNRPEDYEEERRLFYVACTRARKSLDIYAPATIFNRAEQGQALVSHSPFVREISPKLLDQYKERYGGLLVRSRKTSATNIFNLPESEQKDGEKSGHQALSCAGPAPLDAGAKSAYCRHRIFGRGKIIKHLDEGKVQVNFPGFGLKVILSEYLIPEEQ